VTAGAARLLRVQDAGRLVRGAPADLVVFRAFQPCPFDALVTASRADVRMTMIAGKPCIAEPSLSAAFDAARLSSLPAIVDGSPRRIAAWIGRHVSRMTLQEPGFEVAH
jgi:hypothetical protein